MNGHERDWYSRLLAIIPGLGMVVVIALLSVTLVTLHTEQDRRATEVDRLLRELEEIAEANRASVIEHRHRNELLHHELCLALEHITAQTDIDPPDCPDPIEEPR